MIFFKLIKKHPIITIIITILLIYSILSTLYIFTGLIIVIVIILIALKSSGTDKSYIIEEIELLQYKNNLINIINKQISLIIPRQYHEVLNKHIDKHIIKKSNKHIKNLNKLRITTQTISSKDIVVRNKAFSHAKQLLSIYKNGLIKSSNKIINNMKKDKYTVPPELPILLTELKNIKIMETQPLIKFT